MEGQIRTWDKRDEGIEDTVIVLPDSQTSATPEASTIDRLELILQLREMQEADDRYALYAI